MADFTVRVELTDADWDDYNKLHESMAASGYVRTIVGDDGVRFKLPDAEYVTSKSVSAEWIRDEVQRIALNHNKAPKVLVTQSVSRSWVLAVDK